MPTQIPAEHHLIVPYAGTELTLPDHKPAAADWPALPQLSRLLARLMPLEPDQGTEFDLSPPHERALARAIGLIPDEQPLPDGLLPWAAWSAGITDRACAWFTPCHWQAGMEHVTLQPPEGLSLDETDSRALLDALAPWAQEDGITLVWESAQRWRAEGEVFEHTHWASLDRVAHRRLDTWLPDSRDNPASRTLLRLQNEAQMLFYTHRVNDQRAQHGLSPVNGFWISGTGRWNGISRSAPPVDDTLRHAALRGDHAAWQQAWVALDAGPIANLLAQAEAGNPVQLTLCGERSALSWQTGTTARPSWVQTLRRWLGGQRQADPTTWLRQL